MEQILENEIDDSNCESGNYDNLSTSLSELPKPLKDEENHESLDNETLLEAAKITDDADTGDIKAIEEVPSESAERADVTPDKDCLKSETPEPTK